MSIIYKKEEEVVAVTDNEAVVVIDPEEFGDEEDYDQVNLTYYADGVLTDDFDNPIEDVEAMVGDYALNSFGDFEPDAVHVRNDATKTYYEILRDERNFADLKRNQWGGTNGE